MAFGVVGAIVLVGASLRLGSTERSIPLADAALVSSLRSVSFLEGLPQPTVEHLALACEHRSVPAGCTLVAEGEVGNEFFVVLSGSCEVRRGNAAVDQLSAPASFGEIALLHDEVRVASVITTVECELAVIRQGDFLDAVGRTATSHRKALDVAALHRGPTTPG